MESKHFFRSPIMIFVILWMILSFIAYFVVPTDYEYFWWIAYIFYLSAPTATVIFLFYLTKFYGLSSIEGRVWGLIAIALLLWCIGEWMWFYYAQIAETDPFPSAADGFYIAGYVPFILGIYIKASESRVKITAEMSQTKKERRRLARAKRVRAKRICIILASVILTAAIIGNFIISPTMQVEDYGAMEKGISITYPVLDIILLVLGMVILGAFWDTKTGSNGWKLFSLGIVVMTAADVLFSSLDWEDIYYAQMDFLWVASYLLFLAGAAYQYLFHKSLMTE